MCQICEWGGGRAMSFDVDVLVEKYEDALSCAETWEEKNIYSEILDDLRELKAKA
jgi:hypothetical protein